MTSRAFPTVPWTATDHTDGPLDDLFDALRQKHPDLVVERLVVKYAGDDDNVYFLGTARAPDLVQIDTAPGGQPPFLLEAAIRFDSMEVSEAARVAGSWLTAAAEQSADQPAV